MTQNKQGELHTSVLNELKNGECQPVSRLAQALEVDKKRISKAASVLVQKGLLKRVSKGHYQLTPTGQQAVAEGRPVPTQQGRRYGDLKPRNGTFRQRAWHSMRIRRGFAISDVVSDAGRADPDRDYANAMAFIRQLSRAGVVGESKRRLKGSTIGSNGHKRFVLLKDLGPTAPAFRSGEQVIHDFNSGEDLPCSRA